MTILLPESNESRILFEWEYNHKYNGKCIINPYTNPKSV